MKILDVKLQSKIQSSEGELAQLVERGDRTAEVRGSTPLFSIGVLS